MRNGAFLVLTLVTALASASRAATPGFEEDFASGVGGFQGGSTLVRVTSDGVGGADDPYLEVSNAGETFLGSFSRAPDLNGDLSADGVTGYSFWLRDTGGDDDLEIHAGIGIPFVNFWQSLQGFTPPDGAWQQFSVDLSTPDQWVQIIGAGSFADAIAGSTQLLFRHDLAPYTQFPDPAAADFGLDRIRVLPAPAEVSALSGTGRFAVGLLLVVIAWRAIGHRRRGIAGPAV